MTRTARGALLLVLIGAGMALIYAMALLRFPLLTIYRCTLQNLDKLAQPGVADGLVLAEYTCNTLRPDAVPPADPLVGVVLFVGVGLLFAGYAAGAVAVRSGAGSALLVVAPLVFVGLLIFVYPTTSVDLYDYAFRGRMLAYYGANTFLRVPQEFEGDPLFWYVAWRRAVTAYGPLWEGMSWVAARLAGQAPGGPLAGGVEGLMSLLLGYKLMASLGFLLCAAAIWGALGRIAPEHRRLGLYLWLWNPLALWETAAAAHNDAWMALAIVVAVWAFSLGRGDGRTRGRGEGESVSGGTATAARTSPFSMSPLLFVSFLALTLGGLVKYLALFFGPLLLAAALRPLPGWRARARLVLLGALVCIGAVALAYAPFWAGPDTLRNFSDRQTLFNASWLAATRPLLAAWLPGAPVETVAALVGLGLLLLGVAWSTLRSWEEPDRVAEHMLWLLLWFLFVCNPWFQPWYLVWALALVALQPWRLRMVWCVGLFSATALLSYLAGTFLLPQLGWKADGTGWNGLMSLLIYGPPLLALVWRRSGAARSLARAAPPDRLPLAAKE